MASAVYTAVLSMLTLVYTIYIMNGGDTSQLWLPFFETSLDDDLIPAASFVLVFCILFFVASVVMYRGVKTGIRGFIIPWQVRFKIN